MIKAISMENSNTQISVVIPIGNVDDLIFDQLRALDEQDFYGSFELILSLNNGDPASRAALELQANKFSFHDLKIVDSSQKRSASYARNVGAREAGGKYLLFCDGDDIAAPGWISAMLAALESHRVVGGYLEEKRLGIPGQENWRPPATPGALPTFLGVPYLSSGNMGIERDLFQQAGGFYEDLVRGEDMALSFKLNAMGIDLYYAPDAIVHYRHRKGLYPMLQQHFHYGRGMSQIIMRGEMPGTGNGSGLFRGNSQVVYRRTLIYYLRRGAIALGRLAGIITELWASRSTSRNNRSALKH